MGNISQFQHERTGEFVQVRPELKNPYLGDEILNDIIRRYCPTEHFQMVNQDLKNLGDRIVNEIDAYGKKTFKTKFWSKNKMVKNPNFRQK